MAKTKWDDLPELKTSSMLLAPTIPEHYQKLSQYFDPKLDKILDVGHGNGTFAEYVIGATGVDENSDLISYDLSGYNTLHFSESVGYLSPEIIERLISAPSIKKIVFKDLMCDEKFTVEYFSYDFTTLKKIVLPLLAKYGYNYTITEFIPFRDRWKAILKKYNLVYTSYPKITNVVLVATR